MIRNKLMWPFLPDSLVIMSGWRVFEGGKSLKMDVNFAINPTTANGVIVIPWTRSNNLVIGSRSSLLFQQGRTTLLSIPFELDNKFVPRRYLNKVEQPCYTDLFELDNKFEQGCCWQGCSSLLDSMSVTVVDNDLVRTCQQPCSSSRVTGCVPGMITCLSMKPVTTGDGGKVVGCQIVFMSSHIWKVCRLHSKVDL